MKNWVLYIFLFITAAGICIPCCRADDCCADQFAAHNGSEHEEEGACSPFSACATCPGFTARIKSLSFIMPFVPMHVHIQWPFTFNDTAYHNSFWQPPRPC